MHLFLYLCFLYCYLVKCDSNIFTKQTAWVGDPVATFANTGIVQCAIECKILNCFGFANDNNLCVIYPVADPCDKILERNVTALYIMDTALIKV